METLIKEKIRVVSLFENGQIKPILFSWKKRIYKILRVAFSYSKGSSSAYSKNIGKNRIFYPPSQKTPPLAGMNAKNFLLRRDSAPDEARYQTVLGEAGGEDTPSLRSGELHFSVECEGGMFELSFNRDKFSWEIERVF